MFLKKTPTSQVQFVVVLNFAAFYFIPIYDFIF